MLSAEEENFIKYWDKKREEHSGNLSKLLRGLPMASVFGLPVLLLILCVYFFFPAWYTKISGTSSETFFVVVLAIIIFIFIYAFTRMHFKWEMNEQLYLELKYKQKKTTEINP